MSPELKAREPARRGRKLKADKKRQRYSVSLHPSIVEAAKKVADSTGESFSGMIERFLKMAIKGAS